MSKIEWTEKTWNPTTGCTKTSPGCKHCYAEKMHKRLMAMGTSGYEKPFNMVQFHADRLSFPNSRKKPASIFVNSMSDLFHEQNDVDSINSVIDVIRNCPQHRFQVLTKRADEMLMYFSYREPPPNNMWLGVSVEDRKHGLPRIDLLREVNCAVRFLSVEPLLEDLGEVNLDGIHWVIVGGESGAKARPMKPDWARGIRDQCVNASVPFFFKQWGTYGADGIKRSKGKNGRYIDGRTWEQMPTN